MLYYVFYQKLLFLMHAFNVFHYITFRAIMASLTALFLSLWFGSKFIPILRNIHADQTFKGYEPSEHKQKAGTPTIGGLIIWIGFFISVLLWSRLSVPFVWISLFAVLSFALIGFSDDYLKIKRGGGDGISAKTKMFFQIVFGSVTVAAIFFIESKTSSCSGCIYIPFIKNGYINLGYFYMLFALFVVVGASNAVNLTDGLDGLATGPSLSRSTSLIIFAYLSGNVIFAHYLHLPYMPGSGEIVVVLAALVGSLLGFLWFNCYPAQVFMGDTGSLALGALLGSTAVMIKEEIVLAIAGGIFVLETISVLIQVVGFKTTHERVFKMAPIHHHFELKGWPESKVIVRFWIISLILALLSLTALKLR